MQRQLHAFANAYDADADRFIDDNDGQLSINNPLLFVFIGDQSLEALNAVYENNRKKWNNSKGVLYFHVYQDQTVEKENVFSLRLPSSGSDRKTARQNLHRQFYQDIRILAEFNRLARQIGNRIAEHGKSYSSFQRLNMAFVTRVEDCCNIVLPEIALLLKSLLGESFKLIQMDMYGLIKEKRGEEHEYASSLGISFLRELDRYQDRAYQFEGMLLVTDDQIKLPIVHAASPLFDLVYLLSDKNEHGMFDDDAGMKANYDIICNMNLLKNRKIIDEFDHRHENYNNQHFRQHIQPAETKGPVYSSAGLSIVKRPNQAIALTVLSQFYRQVMSVLSAQSQVEKRVILELFQLNSDAVDRKVAELMPSKESLEEMSALLSESVPLSELKRMSLKQAEDSLYGQHANAFFVDHFEQAADKKFQGMKLEQELEASIERQIVQSVSYGLYCAYAWTSEQDERSIVHELRSMIKDVSRQLEEARLQLLQVEQEPVELQAFSRFSFFDKGKIKQLSRQLFDKIYGQKFDILFFEIKQKLLRRYLAAIESLHQPLREKIEVTTSLDKLLKETSRHSVSEANDYLGRNIPEYYEAVVEEIIQDLQAKRGTFFYFEDRYVGNIAALVNEGAEALLNRFIEVCRKEVFVYPQFRQSFEDELLERANVTVRYEDKGNVLSKEELYRDLYIQLEERAAIHMQVFNYTQKHRYEEKYFFADYDSEFIHHAFSVDKGVRLYKLGCVHEKKATGIEKLNIMGGFQLEDLMYVVNNTKYYESYKQNGFQFHA